MLWELVGTAAAGGTTSATTAPARIGKGNFGFDGKAHVRQVDAHAAHGFKKIAGDAKGKSVLLKNLVFGSRLIQSQSEARAASAASGEIHADSVFSLSAKYASSSWEAVSLIVNMIVSSGINDEEGKRTNAGKRHIRLLQKVVYKSQMAREPFVRAFLTESLFAQREPRRMVRFEHIGTGGPFGAVPQPQP